MHKHHGKTEGTFIDPICGMTVSPESAARSLESGGEKIYFCSNGCLEKFKKQAEAPKMPPAGMVQLGRKNRRQKIL